MANFVTHARFLKAARPRLRDNTLSTLEVHGNDLLCISVHYDTCVVGRYYYLTSMFVLADLSNNQVIDQVIVEVIFWLIEDDGIITI